MKKGTLCPRDAGGSNVCGSIADVRTAEVETLSENSNLFAKKYVRVKDNL